MSKTILDRILQESRGVDVLELLAEQLTPTDLQSLLLEVYRRRASRRTPAELLAAYERNPFVRPSAASPELMLELDRLAFSLAVPPFEPLELAPVCPLGSNSVVASVDQNKTIATIRNTELVSDSTNVLALEGAARRRLYLRRPEERQRRVHLCASHRLLRPQRFDKPASLAHFRLFALCTAGRDEGADRFELEALEQQLRFYLRLLSALPAAFHLWEIRADITELGEEIPQRYLHAAVLEPLAAAFPDVRLGLDPARQSGRNYYTGLCFGVYARDSGGTEYMLADGGFTTWTQQLISSRKERLLISGIGTERLCTLFHAGAASAGSS